MSDEKDIADDCEVSLGYYRGPLDAVLAGLERARLDGAVLELDGGADALAEFVDTRTREHPELSEANRRNRGALFRLGPFTIQRGGGPSYLPIEGDNLAELRALAAEHADPLIASELAVTDSEGGLLWAPDVGDMEIFVSERLPEASVNALRAALGDDLTRE